MLDSIALLLSAVQPPSGVVRVAAPISQPDATQQQSAIALIASITPPTAVTQVAWANQGQAQPGQPILKLNSQGQAVVTVQQQLQQLGYSLNSDGLYDQTTQVAVMHFQHHQGLKADGIVGQATWDALTQPIHAAAVVSSEQTVTTSEAVETAEQGTPIIPSSYYVQAIEAQAVAASANSNTSRDVGLWLLILLQVGGWWMIAQDVRKNLLRSRHRRGRYIAPAPHQRPTNPLQPLAPLQSTAATEKASSKDKLSKLHTAPKLQVSHYHKVDAV